MTRSLARRIDGLARAHVARRRTHYLFRGMDETPDQVEARMRAMIASGEASQGDRFVIFSWKSGPDDDAATD
jgi:hypothetical protein